MQQYEKISSSVVEKDFLRRLINLGEKTMASRGRF
tara:strand:- start:962 stop:1066 length:105 start_codon:yes stop_codon:yes gene_type:complete